MRLFRSSNTPELPRTSQNPDNGAENPNETFSESGQVETRPSADRCQSLYHDGGAALHLKSTPTTAESPSDDNATGEQAGKHVPDAKTTSQSLLSLFDGCKSGTTSMKRESALQGAHTERSNSHQLNGVSSALPSDPTSLSASLNGGQVTSETPSNDLVLEPEKSRPPAWLWPAGRGSISNVPKRSPTVAVHMPNAPERISAVADQEEGNQETAPTGTNSSGSYRWLGLWRAFQSDEQSQSFPRDFSSKIGVDSQPTSTEVTRQGSTKSTEERPISGWAVWSRYRRMDPNASKPKPYQVGKLAFTSGGPNSPVQEAQVHTTGICNLQPEPSGLTTAKEPSKTTGKPESSDRHRAGHGAKETASKMVARPSCSESFILPPIRDCFATSSSSSGLLQHLSHWVYGTRNTAKWTTVLRDAPHTKKALAIGVHGLFPAPMLQTILGKPTGTSMKFAEMAAQAIQEFAQSSGRYMEKIETIALEGSGKIDERLDALWKILLNWIDLIRGADLIYLACHSQGVPVGIILASRLVQSGFCKKGVRIGVCAMAGVNLGPFVDYKSRWLGGSAGELFDFGQPNSGVSMQYQVALSDLLRSGAKVAFIGSLDDQLVPLYSSTFLPVQHPQIYRAVWVDGRLRLNFLSALVGFSLKLRNLGISDHGVVSQVSAPLAGSLYGGEGHSVRIFNLSGSFFFISSRAMAVPASLLQLLPPIGLAQIAC